MSITNQQYVTLVAQGGTPVRLADQYGAPYATTGHGALVFNNGPTLLNVNIEGATFSDVVIDDVTLTNAALTDPTINGGVLNNVILNSPILNNPIITGQTSATMAVAYGANGQFYSTPPIVSPQCYSIRDIFQTYVTGTTAVSSAIVTGVNNVANLTVGQAVSGASIQAGTTVTDITGTTVTLSLPATASTPTAVIFTPTISIRLDVIPSTTPATLSVRVSGGLNGLTRGLHPADSMQDNITEVPWTLGPGPDPFTRELAGSSWVPASVFSGGYAYVPGTLVIADPELNLLLEWARLNAPATVQLPVGALYVKYQVVRVPENVTFLGHGNRTTYFFLTDQYAATHADQSLSSNPFTPLGVGSRIVSVHAAGHNQVAGQLVRFTSVTAGDGITIPNSNFYAIRAVIDANNFTIQVADQATGTTSFGGSGVTARYSGGPSHVIGTGTMDGAPSYSNVANTLWQGFTVYGNRGHQTYRAGQHAIDLGGDLDVRVPLTITWRDIHDIGSAGYGVSFGGFNAKVDIFFEQSEIRFTDGDNIDDKNRLSLNNVTNVSRMLFGYHAMGDQGTNLKPIYAVPNNGATTAAGSSIITLRLNSLDLGGGRAGETVTITGATVFNGVNINGTWLVLTGSGTTNITFECGQVASGPGTGGGAGMHYFLPNISIGDNIVDTRGLGWTIRDCYWEGELFQRNGFSQRGGSLTGPAGLGGDGLTISNVRGLDLTRPEVAGTDGGGRGFVTLRGRNANVRNIFFQATSGVGISTNATDTDAPIVSDFYIEGVQIGITCFCDNGSFSFGRIVNATQIGVQVYGGEGGVSQEPGNDPLNGVTLGQNIINVLAPNHGRTTGQQVGFAGVVNANGLVLLGSNTRTYPCTVVDADNFTVMGEAGPGATATTPYGGDDITLEYPSGIHIATNNRFFHVLTIQDGANTAVGWSVGSDGTRQVGRAANTWIDFCDDDGSSVPRIDYGDNTSWGSMNGSSLLTNVAADTVTAPGLETDSWGDPIWSLSAPRQFFDGGNLRHYRQIRVEFLGLKSDSITTPNLFIAFTQDGSNYDQVNNSYNRVGASAGTENFLLASAVPAGTECYGVIEVNNFNQTTRSWADINGGQKDSALGVHNSSGFTSQPHATISITAGTSNPGVNVVADIQVNDVSILSGPVDWTTSNTATATAVAANINALVGSLYSATSSTNDVTIKARVNHNHFVGQSVEVTVGGDVVVVPATTELAGNPWQGLRIGFSDSAQFTGGTVNIYGKQ